MRVDCEARVRVRITYDDDALEDARRRARESGVSLNHIIQNDVRRLVNSSEMTAVFDGVNIVLRQAQPEILGSTVAQ